MTLRPEFSLGHSEFNDFLFASVGEEKSGLPLTVLSALTRLGVDPWGEAARLAGLPKEKATQALATAIALLPEGDWKSADSWAIATRLVTRLPVRGAPILAVSPADRIWKAKPKSGTALWLVAVLAAVLLFTVSYQSMDHTAAPVSNGISSEH
ncbi:MAG TPA: hypothetical protein VN809_13090 [Telmatospirillum sp.]|nr:hypothetical protein [Telmatospirillum sp.]